ncbi:hypothetical protein L195_g063068 [Trifolium pratense]|uniref:Uncharacterized protein n=1 Tax=Trifolium pratense TaxID=57577 RepID=A0A2K3KJM4_TRIPR|nr:hypothetical protein L195_g063068 [Trifolium pratense]
MRGLAPHGDVQEIKLQLHKNGSYAVELLESSHWNAGSDFN